MSAIAIQAASWDMCFQIFCIHSAQAVLLAANENIVTNSYKNSSFHFLVISKVRTEAQEGTKNGY